ncbi:hypothetical protein AFIC_002229 [[Pseudomonas] carboxydohydrogena]|uniref:Uncharacterized protein n=1 Tax=Afipia carboxydohydrogena TaxID=290 RepID=A0ABY8BMG5_AFICR|nr:hypothetical protein [[Pseudomonas] carboxydohydrogena]WEF50681.1 hypothetical protein AFIC_002229 [[Pseudomonas] carboxydohydrogena]
MKSRADVSFDPGKEKAAVMAAFFMMLAGAGGLIEPFSGVRACEKFKAHGFAALSCRFAQAISGPCRKIKYDPNQEGRRQN